MITIKNLTHNKSAHLGQLRKETDTINMTFAQSTCAVYMGNLVASIFSTDFLILFGEIY